MFWNKRKKSLVHQNKYSNSTIIGNTIRDIWKDFANNVAFMGFQYSVLKGRTIGELYVIEP